MKPKRKPVLWRAVFSERNSDSSAKIRNLNTSEWWTDSLFEPVYIHAPHKPILGMEGTVHRVYPVPIKGYLCHRLGMRRRVLCWIYDPLLWKSKHSK